MNALVDLNTPPHPIHISYSSSLHWEGKTMATSLGSAFSSPSATARIVIPNRALALSLLSRPRPLSLPAARDSPPPTAVVAAHGPRSPAPHTSRQWKLRAVTESLETDAPPSIPEPVEAQLAASEASEAPKREDVFAVVMIGSRQYIVFPGRFITTQRLKGANADDKIILNKVLLVGTRTKTYIGQPVVTNAAVHAVVEEQGLNRKVVVYKYKRKKNYRRNIGHRQPNTRIRITGITGYQEFPFETLESVSE